jgi:calpain-15
MDLGPVEWRRAADIPGLSDATGLHLFAGAIEPNDIKQGQIGDCYFLSSLAALAERPDRIRSMFLQEEGCNGMYAARMYKNGVKMVVTVDDLIPCKGDSVAFARSNGAELWVLLLEKMWAKLHGCYDRIAGGLEYETIRDLSGAPGYFFSGIDDDAFERIFEYDELNYMMGCSMSETYDQEQAEKQGIVAGHAYTLLAAARVRDQWGQEHRLVKLRNPWGSGEWNGKWSDKSSEWTADLRRQVSFDGDRDDGIFWMDFEEFKEIYGFWSVNKYIEGAKFNHKHVS